jgi:hypothetical protein
MKVCVCGKLEKKIELDKQDVVIVYSIVGLILIAVGFFDVMLSLGIILILIGYLTLATIFRMLLGWHKPLCSLRWALISIARVLQYF